MRSSRPPKLLLLLLLLIAAALLRRLRSTESPQALRQPGQEQAKATPTPAPPAMTTVKTSEELTAAAATSLPAAQSVDDRQPAARLDSLVLRVDDDSGLEAMRQAAAQLGLRVAGAIPPLRLLMLQGDRERLAALATAFPSEVLEYDVPVFLPEPKRSSTASGRLGQPFGAELLDWLGVNQDNPDRGDGVTVALLDTAVAAAGSLGNANLRTLDLFTLPQEGDYAGHGQAVASLLAGQSELVQGVAPGVKLLVIPVLDGEGTGSAFQVAEGIVAAVDAGAELISMSLGAYDNSMALRSAVEYAHQAGTVIVAAAGNDGYDQLLYPAAYPTVIAVSAVSADAAWADFSNHGPGVDIAAPGVGLYAEWPDPGGDWVEFTGTSAAVPSVTGVIANLLANNPEMSAADAADLVLDCADDAGAPGQDDFYGAGILNAARVDQANTPGIYDAAIAAHFLNLEKSFDDFHPIDVTVQNRGTETLPTVVLTLTLDGHTTTHQFVNVAPGAIVAATVTVDARQLADGKTITLTSSVETPGVTDTVPGNETRSSVLYIK
ncbi:MAG: S8 family serine peptidase [Lentisphaerae bacterium]|nr:S8 family serine peptidase [Lentisphaerota bacterium]OQC12101.1 MAG: Subtilisin DY [Lentisphaerae bacterium ADurb.Bin082]